MRAGTGLIDEQRLRRATHARAPELRIQQHGAGHVEIGLLMHIDMIVAVEMRENRHAGFGLHARNEALPRAAR